MSVYESISIDGAFSGVVRPPARWIKRCKRCKRLNRVEGHLGTHRIKRVQIIASTLDCTVYELPLGDFYKNCDGCGAVVRLERVYDAWKPGGKPRHECNAKCRAASGPACECRCHGKNHGSG